MRLLEVIAEDRLELEPASALRVDLVGPAHEVDVQGGAGALQEAAVDRVAHQVMVEAVQRVRIHGGDRMDKLLARQRQQMALDRRAERLGRERGDGRCGELQADDRSRFDRRALLPAQLAEASLDQRLDRRRNRDLAVALGADPAPVLLAQGAAVDQHRQHLLDVERVALGSLDDPRHHVVGQPGGAEQVQGHFRGRGIGQRPQHQPDRRGPLAPVGSFFQQIVA